MKLIILLYARKHLKVNKRFKKIKGKIDAPRTFERHSRKSRQTFGNRKSPRKRGRASARRTLTITRFSRPTEGLPKSVR